MSNNSNISPNWAGFHRLWKIVAIILLILLILMWLFGYGPGGKHCKVEPTIVEKVVEKEKLVDNPELLTRIGLLEKENAQIALLKTENEQISGLKTSIADLTKQSGLVAGLQAKVKALEAVDLNFENPNLIKRIGLLETENASIDTLKKRIVELEASNAKSNDDRSTALMAQIETLKTENGLIAGLKAKVAALEAVDVNFIQPKDDSKLLQKINNLEVETLKIPGLKARIEDLQAKEPTYIAKIGELEKENGLIAGLKAKVSALEAVDVNFIQPKDDSKLLQKINNLEVETLKIPGLKARIEDLQAKEPTYIAKIAELEKQNGLIPGLQAKVKALEAVDINFVQKAPAVMATPNTAKLYFESGSSRFPEDNSQSMADVVVYLRANPSSKVSLVGFHDASGKIDWNRRLATKRSNRVRQVLINAGISTSRINVETPSQTLGTGLPEEARRVEVRVFK